MCETDNASRLPQLSATLVDLNLDLDWLESCASLEREVYLLLPEFSKNEEIISRGLGIDLNNGNNQHRNKDLLGVDSTPELDSDDQTSESSFGIAEECTTMHLTPAQIMLDLLPKDCDGRFGSFYSQKYDSRSPEIQFLHEKKAKAYVDGDEYRSRFSWGSSNYSDMSPNPASERNSWWEPIRPLAVEKETPVPPPIPTKSPLRLMRKLGEISPKEFSNKQSSRNVHNLHLHLSRPSINNIRESLLSPLSKRKQSHASPRKKDPMVIRSDIGSKPKLKLTIPSYIPSTASGKAGYFQASEYVSDNRKALRNSKFNTKSNVHGRSQSTQEVANRPVHPDRLIVTRGHTRATSDFGHKGGGKGGTCNKWDESMPLQNCVRRSCITSPAKESGTRTTLQVLDINKRLPPLPVPEVRDTEEVETWL
ncbi:hypothetical protein GQ44DRAFT_723332 [Phaeosphaeriaceae sp. PMI808]|nr:hypothetical protein GQ44DRAFT_723332 [Phaeosphaeriaceae sp. PMI808]